MSTENFIEINGNSIKFQYIVDKRLKNTYIQIKDGSVIIKGRRVTLSQAKELIEKKSDWVLKHLDRSTIKKQKKEELEEFKTVKFFGKDYETEIIPQPLTRDVSIYFNDKFLIFVNPQYVNDKKVILDAVYEFYRKKAEREIPILVYEWAKLMSVKPSDISFKKMKKRWGSCSYDGKLCFNVKIAALERKQIDYVIVHELAHITEMNHSRDFWNIVEKYIPDYKEIHKNTLGEVV